MYTRHDRRAARSRRHRRVRKQVTGTAARPRLCVHRSLQHITVQLIDDVMGHTLVAASSRDQGLLQDLKSGACVEAAARVGRAVAEKAKARGCETVVFDRGGYLYHGRVAALATAARQAGLRF